MNNPEFETPEGTPEQWWDTHSSEPLYFDSWISPVENGVFYPSYDWTF